MTRNRKAKSSKITMFNKCILKHLIFVQVYSKYYVKIKRQALKNKFRGHFRSSSVKISEKMSNLKLKVN